jgi:DNA-binding transcriptional MerR regulator
MALMDIFKKKTPEAPAYPMPAGMPAEAMAPPMPSEVPIAQVVSMQTQGLSNNQIIQSLQRQGFAPTQIYDALAQAEAKKSIEPMEGPTETPAMQKTERAPTHPESEAIVEQIIEEKWHELQKDLGKVTEWKDTMTSRLDKMEQSMTDVKADLDGLHKAIVARIGEYDKTLMDVGTEVKAMEKVFQKVLPELTGNIQELSRITKTVKNR